MKKTFEQPIVNLESLQANEAIMWTPDTDSWGWEIGLYVLSGTGNE